MRAQSAIEYILLTGMILLFILPLSIISINVLSSYRQSSSEAQIQRIGNDIIVTSELVNGYGAPSQLALPVVMPAGVNEINVTTNRDPDRPCNKCTELRFITNNGIIFFTTNITIRPENVAENPETLCVYPDQCSFDKNYANPGNKNFIIKAAIFEPAGSKVPYVTITS